MTDAAMAKIGALMTMQFPDELVSTLCEDPSTIEHLRALAREYERLSSSHGTEGKP